MVLELEELEKSLCNMALVFAEVFKDEINANDEQKLYNGVKRVIKKYSENRSAIDAIDEFFRVISGGASLSEIFRVARDEALEPSAATDLTVDKSCD